MSAAGRRSPRANVDALLFVAWLDSLSTHEEDVDGRLRLYINNVHPDADTKRELRRYRNGHVATLRPSTVSRLLSYLNLNMEDLPSGSSDRSTEEGR